ncbi:recombinase RecT [Speluncibacter jeojiensis]|uniref:Recombinase RecT n=1 Tax=Speluncibacter jeojiensis TaxID=2710754 RepID=A0A9X4M1S2_9ACTN|nr:recombinase RecT [Corynebacteriales bacterium D3-21]
MTTELATQGGAELATTTAGDLVGTTEDRGVYRGGHSDWTPEQRDQLRALGGLDEASDGDIAMLKAVSDRSGLDPFVKQVYLVGRKTKTGGYRGEAERWETKWSVQVGIDGFRAVTHRYASEKGLIVEIGRPVFYNADGDPQKIWLRKWGYPAAAEVTITVGQATATTVATWDEYVQTKRDGSPNSMWDKMPTVMLAKCAEAQAHRRVCPLTAGMHEAAEMAHLDSEPVRVVSERVAGPRGGTAALREKLGVASNPVAEVDTAQVEAPAKATAAEVKSLRAALDTAGITTEERPAFLAARVGHPVKALSELTSAEIAAVLDFLANGEPA